MKLFYSPLACSMATRITLDELGRTAEYLAIDHTTRLAPDGSAIHPLGMVPVLHTDDGHVLTENSAILQYVAADTPLVPRDPWQRAQLQQWLSFVGTELHKAVFIPLLDKKAPDGAKAYALANAEPRLAIVEAHLANREYLLDAYSVADIYLATVLNWAQATPIRLDAFPAVATFFQRMKARPVVARVLATEIEAFIAERGRPALPPPSTRAVIDRFNDAFQRHDASALDTLVDEGCVIENTDGARHAGRHECVALWTAIATDPSIAFDLGDVSVAGDDATIVWTLRKDGVPAARGVNLMHVHAGRIVHARGYTKPA